MAEFVGWQHQGVGLGHRGRLEDDHRNGATTIVGVGPGIEEPAALVQHQTLGRDLTPEQPRQTGIAKRQRQPPPAQQRRSQREEQAIGQRGSGRAEQPHARGEKRVGIGGFGFAQQLAQPRLERRELRLQQTGVEVG